MLHNTLNNLPPLLTWEIDNEYIEFSMSSITLQQMRDKLADARKQFEIAKREVAVWEQVVSVEESKMGVERPMVESTNKSETLRLYLQTPGNRQKGVTYKMIRVHYADKGIPMGSNFIYNLIDKWEQKGDVVKRDGRIFWKGD